MRKEPLIVLVMVSLLAWASYSEVPPFRSLMDWRSGRKALAEGEAGKYDYRVYDYSEGGSSFITIDFLKGKHFWNPQVAVWLQDTTGTYITTLFVTNSTARGLFYGGRSMENFKDFDGEKGEEELFVRRVNALPYWSHKRGIRAKDGEFAPHKDEPLPDAISGATPVGNFYLKSKTIDTLDYPVAFRVMMEINVAFDQNEYYSEYDFLDDSAYHEGTGLLGQPSLVYGKTVRRSNTQKYYVLDLLGRGHHSGKDGKLYTDLQGMTTAREIAERVVVGIKL